MVRRAGDRTSRGGGQNRSIAGKDFHANRRVPGNDEMRRSLRILHRAAASGVASGLDFNLVAHDHARREPRAKLHAEGIVCLWAGWGAGWRAALRSSLLPRLLRRLLPGGRQRRRCERARQPQCPAALSFSVQEHSPCLTALSAKLDAGRPGFAGSWVTGSIVGH